VVLGIRGGCRAAVGHKGGLRERLQGPIKEEAGGLGMRAPVGIAVMISVGEADRATARRDSARGKKFLEGGRARETGRWARVRVRGGAGPRAVTAQRGGTEGAGVRRRREGKGRSPTGGVRLRE
jgi:hypothetical protein